MELIVVMVILGVLAAVAIPKFSNLTEQARINIIENIRSSAITANVMFNLENKVSDYSVKVCPNFSPVGRISDVYLDGRPVTPGNCPSGSVTEDDDGLVRLIWGWIDNTHLHKVLMLNKDDDTLIFRDQGYANLYIGYDLDGNGSPINDNCYFLYVQSSTQGVDPQYSTVTSGCH